MIFLLSNNLLYLFLSKTIKIFIDMEKIKNESDLYKDLPKKELKKIIRQYKFLSFSNSELYYFLYTMLTFGGTFLFFFGVSYNTIFVMFLLHYIFYWEILYKTTKFKSIDKKEKEKIDQIVEILQQHLKEKK
jgi:hypothetical protein